jgi:hypothetical protein
LYRYNYGTAKRRGNVGQFHRKGPIPPFSNTFASWSNIYGPRFSNPATFRYGSYREGNKRLAMYVAAEKEIAKEKKCQLVDLHAFFLTALAKKPVNVKGNWLTGDGVHMKPLGDAIMAAGVLRALGVPDAKVGVGVK